MAKVELKQPIVQEIADQIQDAQSVVLVDYRGLTVDEDTQLRKQLREAGFTKHVFFARRSECYRNFQRGCNSTGKDSCKVCKGCTGIRAESRRSRRNFL